MFAVLLSCFLDSLRKLFRPFTCWERGDPCRGADEGFFSSFVEEFLLGEVFFLQNGRDRLVFTPPFFREVLGTSGQGIRFPVVGPWAIVDAEIDASQLLSPLCLPPVQKISRYEVFEVLMIRVNLQLVDSPFAVSAPVLVSINDC